MKPFWAILLASLILVQSIVPRAYVGLLQSPKVWQHFKEHQVESKKEIGLWEFIEMHYGADSEHIKKKCHHLPSLEINSAIGCFILPNHSLSIIETPIFILEPKPNFFWLNLYSYNTSNKLIYPPRA